MPKLTPKASTEADLESAITAAVVLAFPRLKSSDIQHQVEFSIRLGHAKVTAKGREGWVKRGRADILLKLGERPLAILELKKAEVALSGDDGRQGLSYARLLDEMAPFVVITNGADLRILETFSGKTWIAESPDGAAFEALMKNAAVLAAGDRHAAVETLMGTDPQVWTAAVAAASAATIDALSATPELPFLPFGVLRAPRLATREVAIKLGGSRLVLLAGEPLSGKTNVLGELVGKSHRDVAATLFVEGGASGVFRQIADLLTQTLDWPITEEEARTWMRRVSHAGGPGLILAIDRLDPTDRDDVRRVEELISGVFGPAVRVLVGVDSAVLAPLLVGPGGRGHSIIGRNAQVVQVGELADPEFARAEELLEAIDMGIMPGGQHGPDLRRPWLLQSMATRASGLKRTTRLMFPSVPGTEVIAQARATFSDAELRRRYGDLARAVVADAQDETRPYAMILQLTSRYYIRRQTLEENLLTEDIAWLLQYGYLRPSFGEDDTPIVTVALPELLASELARHLAAELRPMVVENAEDAAAWLAGGASNLLLGDVIAAQAIFDLAEQGHRLPFNLIAALVLASPQRSRMQAGQHLLGWMEGVGRVEFRPQADGSTIYVVDGEEHHVEDDDILQSVTYTDVHAWLILSHVAAKRMAVEKSGVESRLDRELLLTIGTADLVLRPSRNDILLDSLPMHDTEDGGQFVCHRAGVVEAITQSMMTYLSREPRAEADAFVAEALEMDNLHLTARLDIAMRLVARSANQDLADWARQTWAESVRPAMLAHLPEH